MVKTAKKAAKKTSSGPAKKSKSSSKSKTSSPGKTRERTSVSSSKPTGPPARKLSGEQIESELAGAHKALMEAAFPLNYMLTRRRLNLKAIEAAAAGVADANEKMKLLLTTLRGP